MSGECDESVNLCIIGLDRILSDVAYENQRKGGKQIRYFILSQYTVSGIGNKIKRTYTSVINKKLSL